jgi:hypothetical protein
VTLYKVFTFGSSDDVVVRLNDCIDESYALQVLAAYPDGAGRFWVPALEASSWRRNARWFGR